MLRYLEGIAIGAQSLHLAALGRWTGSEAIALVWVYLYFTVVYLLFALRH